MVRIAGISEAGGPHEALEQLGHLESEVEQALELDSLSEWHLEQVRGLRLVILQQAGEDDGVIIKELMRRAAYNERKYVQYGGGAAYALAELAVMLKNTGREDWVPIAEKALRISANVLDPSSIFEDVLRMLRDEYNARARRLGTGWRSYGAPTES